MAVRFLLEICVLISVGYWGFNTGSGWFPRIPLGIGMPLLIAVTWSMFGAPKAPYHLIGFKMLVLEFVVFGSGVAALVAMKNYPFFVINHLQYEKMDFYIGCPIWSFKGWAGNFYPQRTKPGDFLREYTRRLTTVEGNTTFYAIPPKNTIESWVAEMPEGFHFCPKLPQAISHKGTLAQHIEDALSFIDIMSQLGLRLGPMFLQLPPRYSPNLLADLEAFLAVWPRDVRLAVEVRHLDWFDAPNHKQLNDLLAQHDMARVVIDTRPIRNLKGDVILRGSAYESLLEARERKPDVPVIPERTANFVFIRYIGHPQLAYNITFLDEWAEYLALQLREGADAYVFCHSPDNMIAPDLCRALHQRVAEQFPIPPLPWDETDASTLQQGRLF